MTVQPSISFQILDKLWRLNRIFCSSDYDASLDYLQHFLPFKIHEYRSKEPYKGWVIPPKWDLIKATINFKGKAIYEVDHPLKIIGLSKSFKGTVSLEELKLHLHYDHRNPNHIPYHFRQHYRPWEREWGFCVTQQFYDSLQNGMYDVDIVTDESEGYLKVAEYVKEGSNPESFAFVAHLDHPGMCNDDLSGVAVGVELFHRLSQIETKFSYRLVLVQEIIGSVHYLDKALGKNSNVLEACFIEMLGTKTELALQNSRHGKTYLEKTLEKTILDKKITFHQGPFRTIVSNDEAVWESHGIPMSSLARFPYPEYHSDKDNMSIMFEDQLKEVVTLLYDSLMNLEKGTLLKKKFEGVYSLAHPSYNLYIDPGQPAFRNLATAPGTKLRGLMDEMSLLPSVCFVETISSDLELPVESVLEYLRQWEEKGLISLI